MCSSPEVSDLSDRVSWVSSSEGKCVIDTLLTELTASELSDYTLGSKLQITAWYTYTALLWSLKGTMLAFFARMTIGTWHKRMVNYISIICAGSYVAVFLTVSEC